MKAEKCHLKILLVKVIYNTFIDEFGRFIKINFWQPVGEELRPIGAPKEKWTVEDEKPSLHRKLEECEKLVKEKEEKMEIIAGKLKSMKKQLDEAIEAKSEADLTVCVLNGKLNFFQLFFVNKIVFSVHRLHKIPRGKKEGKRGTSRSAGKVYIFEAIIGSYKIQKLKPETYCHFNHHLFLTSYSWTALTKQQRTMMKTTKKSRGRGKEKGIPKIILFLTFQESTQSL